MVTCDPSTVTLTPRQRDVLRLVAQGCCNKTMARMLGLSVRTVKCHLSSMYAGLRIKVPVSGTSAKRAMATRIYLLSWSWCEFPRERVTCIIVPETSEDRRQRWIGVSMTWL